MWRLWHSLTGTHFVVMEYGWGEYTRRVRFTMDGKPYVKICGTHCWLLGYGEKWESLTFDKAAWLANFEQQKNASFA